MYVYIYIGMYVFIYVICIYIYICVCVFVCMYAYLYIYIYIYVNWTILCIQLDVNKVISCCINMLILLDWKVLAKYAVFNVVTDIYNQS